LKKQKYYVVWKGLTPGVYNDWETCKFQVNGVEGAIYKSFKTKAEAEEAYKDNPWNRLSTEKNIAKKSEEQTKAIRANSAINREDSICVDGACSGNPGDMEYRGVVTATGKEIFRVGPLAMGTNNIGEFLALVHAAAYLQKLNRPSTVIYSDSVNAMLWVKNKAPKTKLIKTSKNEKIFELIDKAVNWLKNNKIPNPILKWETKDWGENPADFGRK
jgi:ribonuclease HI